MYKNKSKEGKNNITGSLLKELRISRSPKLSQNQLADELLKRGLDVDKNAIQRMESGQRFITDIELKAIAEYFGVSADDFLNHE